MALKKTIAGTTQYYYLVISYVGYKKNTTGTLGHSHMVEADLQIKDSKDPKVLELKQTLRFNILLPDAMNGLKVDPLSVSKQNPAGKNITALVYDWIKKNEPLFADFTSV